jgi:zinc protease
MKRLSAVSLLLCAVCAVAAEAPRKVVSLEGVTEYQLANGLHLLTLPDPSIDTITLHVTYLVGSRHEGYGEKGMAHLLEHLLFKGSKGHPNMKEEFTRRGARRNGTTSDDRTTYFETFAASDDNLAWAIELEADRMLNSFVSKEDLDSEMSVVRNEFELGENNPGSVLFQRMQQAAYPWHNYGNPIIGMRSDIERVPIDKLQAFYRTWYQPDNALLIVAGRFDEARALELVGRHFGALPRPSRALPTFYTEEPTQDGERTVFLRRSGDNPIVSSMYRVPAGAHPEYPAIDVLTNILGDVPAGRLHRAIVQKGLASYVWGAERGLHDPGYVYFGAGLDQSASLDRARDVLIQVVENLRKERITVEEVERARTALLNEFEKSQLETGAFVRALSEFAATGSWRLFFLYRERLRKVTLDDVQRVAERYLKPANRVLGIFVPTDQPDRAEIPAATGLEEALTAYRGDDTKSLPLGEAFDPSPANIESRVTRRQLSNGIRAALLPKKTRGGRVVVSLALHWGDEKSLHNREVACDFAGSMLLRGSKKHTRAQLKEAFEKLNATVSAGGEGASIGAGAAAGGRSAARAGLPPCRIRRDEARRDHRRRSAAHRPGGPRQRAAGAPPAPVPQRPSALHADHRGAHREAARRQARRRRSLLPRPARRDRRRLRRGGRIRPRRNGAPRRGALRHLAHAATVRARAGALLRPPGLRERVRHARQGERSAARRSQRQDAR